jgi:hypothetical protein
LWIKAQRFGDNLCLHHQGMMLGFHPQLTRLVAREDLIEFN